MVKLTKRDLGIIAGIVGTTDFLLEGKLSAPVARAIKKAGSWVGSEVKDIKSNIRRKKINRRKKKTKELN